MSPVRARRSGGNAAIARDAFEAYNAGDFDRVLAIIDPEIELVASATLMNSGTFRGHEGFISWVTEWQQAWQDFRTEPVAVTPVGDRYVLLDVHQSGHGAESGIPVALDVFWAFEIRDGRAVRAELHTTRDEAEAAIEGWRAKPRS